MQYDIEYLVHWIMTLDQSPVVQRDDPGMTVSSLQSRGTDGLGNRATVSGLRGKERGEVPSVGSMRWKVRSATPLECTHLHRLKSEVQEKRETPFCKLEAPIKIYVHCVQGREQESRSLSKWQRTGPQSLGTGGPNKLNPVFPPQQANNTNI